MKRRGRVQQTPVDEEDDVAPDGAETDPGQAGRWTGAVRAMERGTLRDAIGAVQAME
jgi:hypothetical protein